MKFFPKIFILSLCILLFSSEIMFGDISLINCSKYELTISYLEYVNFFERDSFYSSEADFFSSEEVSEEISEIVLQPGERCLLPDISLLNISSKCCSFSFSEYIFMDSDFCYKIKLDINRRFKINRETGERKLSRLSGMCTIFEYDNLLGQEDLFA